MTTPDLKALLATIQKLNAGRTSVACFALADATEVSLARPLVDSLRGRIPNASFHSPLSESRAQERSAGNQCLISLWNELHAETAEDPSRLQVSLAHSNGWAIGFGRIIESREEPRDLSDSRTKDPILGVGVDMENRDREVREELRRKIVLDSEASFELTLLEFWVIKEACFKSDPENRGHTVSECEITAFDRKTSTGQAVMRPTQARFRFAVHFCPDWLTAFAVCEPQGMKPER